MLHKRFAHHCSAVLVLLVGLRAVGQPPLTLPDIDPFAEEYKASASPPSKISGLAAEIMKFVELKASVSPSKAKRGDVIRVVIDGTTKKYAYTYSAIEKPTTQAGPRSKIGYPKADWLKPLFPISESKPKPYEGGAIHHEKFQWTQELYIAPDTPPGKRKFVVQPHLQVCTKKDAFANTSDSCFTAVNYAPLEVELEILDGPATAPPANLTARSTAPKYEEVAVRPPISSSDVDVHNLGGLLIAAFVGAILMLLTPCVFPMIPITVNFFVKQSEKEHHRPVFMASVYAGTMVLLLSVVILAVGAYVIKLANDPWFNLGLGAVLVMFALGLFGMFKVDLTKFFGLVLLFGIGFLLWWAAKRWLGATDHINPFVLAILTIGLAIPATLALGWGIRGIESALGVEESMVLRFLADQENKGGMLGAAFMAMTFTITSFSCTGPFLGILLAPIAESKPPMFNLVMAALVYSATFAAPFFVLALFPSWLKKLPKSGGWMTTIKVTMGFVEIGAALKFLAIPDYIWFPGHPRIFTYDTILCAWIALSLGCGLYLFGFFHLDHDSAEGHVGVPRMMFACLFVGMAIYLAPLLIGSTPSGAVMESALAFLPEDLNRVEHIPWIKDDYEKAWQLAVKEKKPIFIDFTGVNCANCRENERNVFRDKEVIELLKEKYVCVALHTDATQKRRLTADQNQELAARFLKYQVNLDPAKPDYTQPTYAIFRPALDQPFDGERLKGQLIDRRRGKIFDIEDFIRFIDAPMSR